MPTSPSPSRRVVVTGAAPVSALGTGQQATWEALRLGTPHLIWQEERIEGERWGVYPLFAVPDFDLEGLPIPPAARLLLKEPEFEQDRDLVLLLGAVALAVDDSGLSYDPLDNRIGLVLTHENPGVDRYVRQVYRTAFDLLTGRRTLAGRSGAEFAQSLFEEHAGAVYGMQSFMYLYWLTRAFGFHGYSLFVNNACASGLYALEAAARQIREGESPVVVVAGGDSPRLITKHLWFRRLGLCAEDGLIQPFDRDRHGFVVGEGAGALVVEDWEHARRRGARVWAEYLGGGFTTEGWKIGLPDVARGHYRRALEQALEASGVRPEEVDLLIPHGVATGVGDRHEAATITAVFGTPPRPAVTALKPYVGHTLGGSGLVELILGLLCVHRDLVPPTLNLRAPDPVLGIVPVAEPQRRRVDTLVKTSNGFGGYNAAAVLRKGSPR